MISWSITNPFDDTDCTIALDVSDGNQYASTEIDGEKDLIEDLKSYFARSTGAFGHLIDLESASAIDLDYALQSDVCPFDVEITEGEEIVEIYDSGIPEGALT